MKLRDELTNTVTPEQLVVDDYRMTSQTIRIVAFAMRKSRIENPYIQCGRITNPTERRTERRDIQCGRIANPTKRNPTKRHDWRSSGKSDRVEEAILFKFFGILCFLCGELITIMGSAKGGKTFLTSMVMACCQMQQVMAKRRGIVMKAFDRCKRGAIALQPHGELPPLYIPLPPPI